MISAFGVDHSGEIAKIAGGDRVRLAGMAGQTLARNAARAGVGGLRRTAGIKATTHTYSGKWPSSEQYKFGSRPASWSRKAKTTATTRFPAAGGRPEREVSVSHGGGLTDGGRLAAGVAASAGVGGLGYVANRGNKR